MGFELKVEKPPLDTNKKPGILGRLSSCRFPVLYPSCTRSRRYTCCNVAVYVRVIWAALSVVVTVSCCMAFIEPYWLINSQKRASFGMYSYCIENSYIEAADELQHQRDNSTRDMPEVSIEREQYVVHYQRNCGPYGHYFRLAHLPSNAWQIACVLFGGGCFLQAFGAMAALVTSVMVDWWASRFASYTGYIQTMGVMTCVGGLLTFPLGLNSNFVRHYCPDARMFYSGECDWGWTFILAIMATALSVFCPFLSQYVTFRIKEDLDV